MTREWDQQRPHQSKALANRMLLQQRAFQSKPSGANEANETSRSHNESRFQTNFTIVPVRAEQPAENRTGMPDQLKAGLENLSGFDLSAVRVHRNSTKPAQLNALAYAQGKDVHLGSAQEEHLPHEGWHVIQQMQGRVKPTRQTKGMAINDDSKLEQEADRMGAKAAAFQCFDSRLEVFAQEKLQTLANNSPRPMWSKAIQETTNNNLSTALLQATPKFYSISSVPIQCKLTGELETINQSYLEQFTLKYSQLKTYKNRIAVLAYLKRSLTNIESQADLLREISNAIKDLGLLEAEPVVVAEAEPVVVAEAEPVVVAEAEPVVVAEAEPQAVNSYKDAKDLASKYDLKNVNYFTSFGGGVNKKAYGVNTSKWVVLCAPDSKKRLILAEIKQILALRTSGVDTPDLGEAGIFKVREGGKEKIAFLEEKIDGFEIPRAGTAFIDNEVKEFGLEVIQFICSQTNLETAEGKRVAGLQSIEALEAEIEKNDIPDFQVRLNRVNGKILALDPGDPLNSQNAKEKHLGWLKLWKDQLTDRRYLSRIWNEKNKNSQLKKDGSEWKQIGESKNKKV